MVRAAGRTRGVGNVRDDLTGLGDSRRWWHSNGARFRTLRAARSDAVRR